MCGGKGSGKIVKTPDKSPRVGVGWRKYCVKGGSGYAAGALLWQASYAKCTSAGAAGIAGQGVAG
jgi:hypothetical protein